MIDTATDLPAQEHERELLKWMQSAIEEGEAFLRSQKGYDKIQSTIDGIMGDSQDSARPGSLSQLNLNYFGKTALDLKAAETDIKPFFNFATKNARFDQQAQMAQKLAQTWWTRRIINMRLADIIAYANAAGTGYAHHVWDPEVGDQMILPEDPRDVIPIRPSSFLSIQESFGVLIRRERTVNYVKARYPWAASRIKADRDSSVAIGNEQTRVGSMMAAMGLQSSFVNNLFSSLGVKPKAADLRVPSVDVFTCYVKDPSTNRTGKDVWMGLTRDGEKTNWSYLVKPNEALYPRKRCIIFTRSAILYDDTNIFWHGYFPITKLTIDPWPWSFLGKAPLRDLLGIQGEIDRLTRTISQHNQRVERPGLAADKNAISKAAMQRIDTARAGLKLSYNPIAGKGVELLHEPPLDPSVQVERAFLIDAMKELSGVRDVTQLMNLGQVPAAETVEKILETMSPSIRLRSQVIEAFITEFAYITLSNFFQFYTLPMRLATLGPQGMTFDDADFDPGTLIPDLKDQMGVNEKGDPHPRDQRAQWFLKQFTYDIAPGSLLASAGMTEKMLYIQLARAGWLDIWTTLEKLGIPNVGEAPAGSIPQRLQAQNEMGIGMQVNPAGRKSSGQSAPRAVIKES